VNPRRRKLRPEALARIVATCTSVQKGSGLCLPMSALGHKRTNHRGPKSSFVRYYPKADIRQTGRRRSAD